MFGTQHHRPAVSKRRISWFRTIFLLLTRCILDLRRVDFVQRVSPKAILEAFETPLPSERHISSCLDDIIAVCRIGFEVEKLSRRKLKVRSQRKDGGPA